MNSTNSQYKRFVVSEKLNVQVSDSSKEKVLQSLSQLMFDIYSDITNSTLICRGNYSENVFLLNEISRIESENTNGCEKHLINIYLIESNTYILKIGILKESSIKAIFSLIATDDKDEVKFSSPIEYRTKHWKKKLIGNVRYFYKDALDQDTASKFDNKNTFIAEHFGFETKKLTFYKCSNYEEVQQILGLDFDASSAGTVQSSVAFENTIITGVNSENFEHDLFHMYIETNFLAGKDRNFIAEEGYANSIADAYYAKNNGKIISRTELVIYLKEFIEKHPDTDLLRLFQEDPRVYRQLSDQVSIEVFNQLSVRSTITSLICDEIEDQKGLVGLIKILRSGTGEDAFFKALEDLIGINKSNFNQNVSKIIAKFE